MTKAVESNNDPHLALLNYRNAPIEGFTVSPAQMMMSRRLRSRIPMISKKLEQKVQKVAIKTIKTVQTKQKEYYDKRIGKENSILQTGDKIRYRNYKDKWTKGKIVEREKTRNRHYTIKNAEGKEVVRNRKLIFRTPNENGKEKEKDKNQRKQQTTEQNKNKTDDTTKKLDNRTAERVSRYGRAIRPVHKMNL